jgi:hypothetical protein
VQGRQLGAFHHSSWAFLIEDSTSEYEGCFESKIGLLLDIKGQTRNELKSCTWKIKRRNWSFTYNN